MDPRRAPFRFAPRRPLVRGATVLAGLSLLASLAGGCRKTGGRPGLPLDDASGAVGGRNGSGAGSTGVGNGGSGNASGAGASSGDGATSGTGAEPPDGGPVGSPREELLGAVAACTREQARIFVEAADALVSATEAQAGSPSPANADAVRAAWIAVVDQWQRLEVFQFGPLAEAMVPGGQGLRSNVYAWPSFNRCFIDQQTESRFYDDPIFVDALPNTRGLGAIEYLAFYTAPDNGCAATNVLNQSGTWAALDAAEIARRRAAYAHAAAVDVRARAGALASAWDPAGGNFSRELAAAGDGSELYPTRQAGFNAVSDAMFYLDTEVKDMKLAWPLGIAECGGPCPLVAESPFAGRSKAHVRNNLIGFRFLYEGCAENGAGLGFDDVLVEIDQAALAERMSAELAAAIAAVDAVGEPAIEAAVSSDLESVQGLYLAVKAVTDSLKTEFIGVLDLARPMGAEGDND